MPQAPCPTISLDKTVSQNTIFTYANYDNEFHQLTYQYKNTISFHFFLNIFF